MDSQDSGPPGNTGGDSAALPPRSPAFSRYTFGREIGRGGMGVVYEAVDSRLGRKVAVKILLEGHRSDDGKRRFVQEAQAASALNHPGIVTIHDVGSDDDVDFIVMEYIDGTPLGRVIAPGGLPITQALDYGEQIAGALSAAHAAGIVHRDLKPANIMAMRDGRIKVLDFGLSKLPQRDALGASELTRSAAPMSMPGVVMGTRGYMSPEQASGEPVDARTDVFSFGVLLYEMLTGSSPFAADSDRSTLRAVLQDEPKSLRAVRPEVPREGERIVARCLEKDPARRYASAVDVHRDLQPLARRSTESGRARLSPRNLWIAGAAVLIVLVAAALGLWTFVRRTQMEAERRRAVADLEHLVDVGKFVEVWRAAHAALQRWPGDPQLEHSLRVTTQPVTIATDPPGAQVAFKAYEDVDGEWLPFGTTPLKDVRAPIGQLRWRITKAGFEPFEARIEVGAPAAAAGRPDVSARPIPLQTIGGKGPRMVFVPGGPHGGVQLADYWIDQTEVTNREYKQFMDLKGYEDAEQWVELQREHPQLLAQSGAGSAFRDRTGRRGPSTWELGTFPQGQEAHPVRGVSWFEAAAYCRANGKSLPTAFHWQRAFGASFFVEVLTLGNFNGRGPEATSELKEVGPYGTRGMAGNVKEWVWNELGGQRYILGGAWNEPLYMAVDADLRPPLDRAETHGFRCIRETAPSDARAYASYRSIEPAGRDLTKEKPVDAATFEVFRRFYSYDRTPLDARVESTEEAEHWRRERVSFAAAYGGERVLANILLPRNAAPPYQTVVWFPGGYALDLTSSERELVFSYYFDFLPRSGRALVYPVYKGTYERQARVTSRSQWRDIVLQWSKDLGRTIDYLESREEFDRNRIAYYGFSMGADSALPAVALESRLKAAIFLAGGLAADGGGKHPEIDPLNFVPRIKIPVLLLAGRNDFYFPVDTSQLPLVRLLGTPVEHKKHVIYEEAGHVPPRIELIREILDWLDRYLGSVGNP